MNKAYTCLFSLFLLSSCITDSIENQNIKGMVFSNIKSDYLIENTHRMPCDKIDRTILEHVLKTGVMATDRDIHDDYSTVGCSIKGTMDLNGEPQEFVFDYGGFFYLGNSRNIACGKQCCEDDFIYCSWNENGLAD